MPDGISPHFHFYKHVLYIFMYYVFYIMYYILHYFMYYVFYITYYYYFVYHMNILMMFKNTIVVVKHDTTSIGIATLS